jgi:hypothetical protein
LRPQRAKASGLHTSLPVHHASAYTHVVPDKYGCLERQVRCFNTSRTHTHTHTHINRIKFKISSIMIQPNHQRRKSQSERAQREEIYTPLERSTFMVSNPLHLVHLKVVRRTALCLL